MIIGLLLRRHVLESFAGPSSIHIGKSLSPFLRSLGIERTKTDRKDEGEQACRQDRAR